ncbi:YdeI/OmpD-associated family protein [Acholeplasma vituli]|uniref:YdeI/OmpD-associated family protein n=1 Tax=Paracholeplasma vituli TaxID=69473 RepID=A0ABT2PVM8_9MOLU|nr:YdeI/OmpD-associated family protein [Paracholeplasma vituli]MCU0105011.1 YdeI/OmpD-associated family protein [Paracholeplasma vituli]
MTILSFINQSDLDSYFLNNINSEGFWIQFSKLNEPKLTYEEAVTTAIKYGFIDGQMKRLNENYYIRYFTKRRPKSIWSTKNKKTANYLIETNQMTAAGLKMVEIAKSNGCWEKADLPPDDFSLEEFTIMLKLYPLAIENFLKMSPSVQKTYALSYYVLKTETSRNKRLELIIKRLEKNLKPMDPMTL